MSEIPQKTDTFTRYVDSIDISEDMYKNARIVKHVMLVCLWFLARNKGSDRSWDGRRTFFIDARKLGTMIDRVHRELTDADIVKVANTCHAWQGDTGAGKYQDVPGFPRSAKTDEIAQHGYVLTPRRYVEAVGMEEDDEPFDEEMRCLMERLAGQFRQFVRLGKSYSLEFEGVRIWNIIPAVFLLT